MAHWAAAKGILRHLKGTLSKRIAYNGGQNAIEIYCDADYAGSLDTRRGYLIKIAAGSAPWSSRFQQTVALSTAEAEYVTI